MPNRRNPVVSPTRVVLAASIGAMVSALVSAMAVADGAHFGPKAIDRPVMSLDQAALLVCGPDRTAAVVRTGLRDAPDGAAWFMPVPTRPYDLRIVDDPFPALDRLSQPISPPFGGRDGAGGAVGAGAVPEPESVVVDARLILGVMDVAVLSAASTEPLLAWLDREGFRAPDGADDVFADYVERGWWWIVAKLAPDSDGGSDGDWDGHSNGDASAPAVPKPIAFTYDAPAVYPMTISRLSASPYTDIVLFVVAARRATALGPHGTPMAEAVRFVDRRVTLGGSLPFLVTQLAMPIDEWLDAPPQFHQLWRRVAAVEIEQPGDRWRTVAALMPLLNAVGLPLPGATATEEAEPAAWITRLRMQLQPAEMRWDLPIVPAGDQSPIGREGR